MANTIRIIWNPISGPGIGKRVVRKMDRLLTAAGFEVEDAMTSHPGDARRYAESVNGSTHTVVCVGGDGTLNGVVNGLGSKGVPLAVFPAGTGNVFWHDIKTPRRVKKFCRMILEHKVRRFDVGEADGRRFISMVGAGFDAEAVITMENMRAGNMVLSMYALPVLLSALHYEFPRFIVEADGEMVSKKAGTVIIGNIPTYGGPFNITSRAKSNDGLLDVLVFERVGPVSGVKFAAKALFHKHLNDRDVKYIRASRVRLNTDRRVPLQIDGDSHGFLPTEIKVHKCDLPVIIGDNNKKFPDEVPEAPWRGEE